MSKLGVFDSGIGGFNVVKTLQDHLDLDVIFLADHKNLPYGNKDEASLKKILEKNIEWFIEKDVDHILLACNTASTFIEYLRARYPDVTIDSIIEITGNYYQDLKNVLVFGTQRTTDVKGYDSYLNYQAEYKALPDLASLVEENDHKKTQAYLRRIIRKLDYDYYILGCTHYSIVDDIFKRYLKGEILDALEPVVSYYKDFTGSGLLEVYSTASVRRLEVTLKEIYNIDVDVAFYQDNFKLVVVSDNHGKIEIIDKILAQHYDAAAFFHCGDTEIDPVYLKDFYTVKGNNDYFYPYPKTLSLEKFGYRFYLTHSDEYFFDDRDEILYDLALRNHYDFVFYGHTHRFSYRNHNDIHILNPGSLFYNRDGSAPSYAVIYINNQEISVERHVGD